MPLDGELKLRMERALGVVDDHGARGTRLLEDARRMCARIHRLLKMGLVSPETNVAALELACHALQLPLRSGRALPTGKLGRTNPRERAEQAAEMLASLAHGLGFDGLLEETSQLLVEVYQRKPEGEGARLLADALNLDDFGVSGLVHQAMLVARQGGGILQVADGCEKREQYGYWDARLKEGFHFEEVRLLARKRLEFARKTSTLLLNELREDGAL